jgi:CDP-paratose 2-epimerase
MRVLVTGGAGFVGSSIALALAARRPSWEVVALDNLVRRGSELNVPRLRDAGVEFVRGDVRSREDVLGVDAVSAVVECAAEPAATSGLDGDTSYVFETNLVGAYNALELARVHHAQMVFVSTSRVYSIPAQRGLRYREDETRFVLEDEQPFVGASARGLSEAFPVDGARSLYGTTKLAAELLVAEYADAFDLPTVVNRCGVIAGPWQMGKVDQGVFTFWMLAHVFGRPLRYIGYGGSGKQVRDLVHVDDVVDLVEAQLAAPAEWAGGVFNVGGGLAGSLSLRETTELCRQLSGNEVPIEGVADQSAADVPIYVSDCSAIEEAKGWRPTRSPREILQDVHDWIRAHERELHQTLVAP